MNNRLIERYYDKEIIGGYRTPGAFFQFSDYDVILNKDGKAATINEAKEMFGQRKRVYYTDMVEDGPDMNNCSYVYSKYTIKDMKLEEKKPYFGDHLEKTKLEKITNKYVRDKILDMDPTFELRYNMIKLPRNDITYMELQNKIRNMKVNYVRKPLLRELVEILPSIINLDLGVVEIWHRLSEVKCPMYIKRLDSGKEFENTGDFMKNVEIEKIVENSFMDLPQIEINIDDSYGNIDNYKSMIINIGCMMKVAICKLWGNEIENPLPEGFQDFSIVDERGRVIM